MLGTLVNTGTILLGTTIGALLRRGIGERYKQILFDTMGLVCLALGLHTAVSHLGQSEYPVLFIVSLVLGGLLGTRLDLAGRVGHLSNPRAGNSLSEGLTTGCLLYCIGTLSIVGPVMSAVYGDHTYLYTNATLDFVTSAVLAATFGWGMLWAALVLFCWQGSIYLLAWWLQEGRLLSDALMSELSIVGGVLILCSGLSILKIKDCRTLNLLPALLVPVLFFALRRLFC